MIRPVAAGVLTILGGFFILVGGFFFALIGAAFAIFGFHSSFFLLGLLLGLVTLVIGFLMIAVPVGHSILGALAVICALVSVPLALGGLVIGFILTLIGGLLAIAWKRPRAAYVTTEGRVVPPPGP
jgi:Family of unknown function (DUF6114)